MKCKDLYEYREKKKPATQRAILRKEGQKWEINR